MTLHGLRPADFIDPAYAEGSEAWWDWWRGFANGACMREADEHASTRLALLAARMVVHRSVDGEKSDQKLACTGKWTESKWGDAKTAFPEVFLLDDDRLFTFAEGLVTCPGCAAWRSPGSEGR